MKNLLKLLLSVWTQLISLLWLHLFCPYFVEKPHLSGGYAYIFRLIWTKNLLGQKRNLNVRAVLSGFFDRRNFLADQGVKNEHNRTMRAFAQRRSMDEEPIKKDKLMLIRCFLFGLVFCSFSCQQNDAPIPEISKSALDEYIGTLASDEFLGRKPFTEGETKTIHYIKNSLEELGLEPGNGNSFFQEVPLVEITPTVSENMEIEGANKNYSLNNANDFVAYTQRVVPEISLEKSDLVFCGYGIVAPEYNWNDYEGIDMSGKTAIVLVNDPGFNSEDSTFFKGKTMTYYGRWTYKYEEAARQGAAGVLIVHETQAAGYPWFVVSNSWSSGKLDLQTANDNADKCAVQGWITLPSVAKMLDAAGLKGMDIFEIAGQPDFKPIPMDANVSVTVTNSLKKDVSQNVVAKITGAKRPDEYIIYSAHWDHLGVGTVVEGDSIYNGAEDNASGTAAVMAIAKAFSEMVVKPERSVVFLFVTAEEQGLLGSAYYGVNPIFPPAQTVANLNMDGMNTFGKMRDLVVTGFGHSELDDYATDIAATQGRYIVPDQEPEKGYFFRSDHFNFAKIGIPALFAKGGIDHMEKGKVFGKEQSDKYTAERYHRPADEYDEEFFDLSGVILDAKLYFEIGRRLAGEEHFPEWKEGSEFKAKREEDLKLLN